MNNMSQIMKQAKAMQEKMAEMQKKIEETEIEGSSGGGAVKIVMNGKHEVKNLFIDPSIVNSDDVNKKIAENTNDQLGSISGGMGLPPGLKLPF